MKRSQAQVSVSRSWSSLPVSTMVHSRWGPPRSAACARSSRCPAAESNDGVRYSVLSCIDKEADDGFFAKRLGGLQPMQAFNEHEAPAVRPYQDRRLLTA